MSIVLKTSHYFNKFIIKNNYGVFIIKVKIIITASTYKPKYLANIKLFKFEMLLIRKKMFGQHPVAR